MTARKETGLAPLGRQHFDEMTLGVMDEIAVLIMATRCLREMRATFDQCDDLAAHIEEFEKTAMRVLKIMRETSADLLQATLKKSARMEEAIASVRARRGKELKRVLPKLTWMAIEATQKADSNVLAVRVSEPIKDLAARWTAT